MIPVKYGSGYNFVQIEQAAAIISINQGDGSVIVHQGGVEMGQGLTTQIVQVASYVLNVPMEMIYVETTRTSVTPHPTSTGGSTGTTYNGTAVKRTCEQLTSRLMEFAYEMLKENGPALLQATEHRFLELRPAGWAAEIGLVIRQKGKEAYLAIPGAARLQQAHEPDCQLYRDHAGRHHPYAGNDIQERERQPVMPGIGLSRVADRRHC